MVEQAEQGRKHYYHYNIWLPLGVLRPRVRYRLLLCETTKSLVHCAAISTWLKLRYLQTR